MAFGGKLAHRPRQHVAGLLPSSAAVDVGRVSRGLGHRREPQLPQLAVAGRGGQVRLRARVDSGSSRTPCPSSVTGGNHVPSAVRRAMKTSRSNRCMSCSFFSSAPASGGTASFSSFERSASGGICSATSSFSQSSNSDVDGFFFSPGSRACRRTLPARSAAAPCAASESARRRSPASFPCRET